MRCTAMILLLGLLMSACTFQEHTNLPPIADDRLTLSFAISEAERPLYEPLAEQFMREYPDIRIVILSVEELRDELREEKRSPTVLESRRWILSHADVTYSSYLSPETRDHNLVLNLQPLMDADASVAADDFYPGMLERYMTSGQLWALPRYREVEVLSYNRDVFRRLNVPFPQSGWTWEELLTTAEQLAQKHGDTVESYGLLDIGVDYRATIEIMRVRGIDLSTAPDGSVRLDSPEVIGFIERIRHLRETGALVPDQYSDANGQNVSVDIFALRRDSRLGMWSDGDFQVPVPEEGYPEPETLPFQVGRVAYPARSIAYFSEPNHGGFVISAGTASPEAAWQWIEFLSRQPGTLRPSFLMPESGSILVPARKSLAEQVGFWDPIDAETAAAYKWAIEHAPTLADHVESQTLSVLASFFLAFDRNLTKSPSLLAAEAQTSIEEALATATLTPTLPPANEPFAVVPPEPAEAIPGTPIRFAIRGRSYSDIKQLRRQFHKQYPDIYVELQSTTVITDDLAFNDLTENSDCFLWSGRLPDNASATLVNLQPLIERERSLAPTDYPAILLAAYQEADRLYGLPYTVRGQALHYRNQAFADAGQPLPSAAWTPDDFLVAAQALTHGAGDAKQYGYIPYNGPYRDVMFFIQQFGGQVLRGADQSPQPNFTDPQVLQAIRWYLDLARVHAVMPPLEILMQPDGRGTEQSRQLIHDGRAAMWFDDTVRTIPPQSTPEAARIDERIAPLPLGAAGLQPDDLYIQSLHISAGTQQRDECWQWLSFIANDASMASWGVLPARTALLPSLQFPEEAAVEAQFIAAYADLLRTSQPSSVAPPPSYRALNPTWFFKAIYATATADADLETELAEAQTTTTAFIECIAQANDAEQCATLVDPGYQQ